MVDPSYVVGVTFDSVREALCMIHFWHDGMTDEDFAIALEHVVPMQHNYENPIVLRDGDALDTWIEYWVDDDDKLAQDAIKQQQFADNPDDPSEITVSATSEVMKVARITVRFIGKKAEMWAKLLHHLTKRKSVATILLDYCNAQFLEYPGPIKPMNVDYFGVQNTAIAYDMEFSLQYVEIIRLNAQPLEFIGLAPGTIQ